jgi:hypothetical protein
MKLASRVGRPEPRAPTDVRATVPRVSLSCDEEQRRRPEPLTWPPDADHARVLPLVGRLRDDGHRNAEPADATGKVSAQPFGDALGQRRDQHVVVLPFVKRALDRFKGVRPTDERIDRAAGGAAEQFQCSLHGPVGVLLGRGVGDEQREGRRSLVRSALHLFEQQRRCCRPVGDDERSMHWLHDSSEAAFNGSRVATESGRPKRA